MLLSKSAYEIENSFTQAEIIEWGEFFSKNPPFWSLLEYQNAMILASINSIFGGKVKVEDFLISNSLKSGADGRTGIRELTAEEINRLAGV